MPMVFSAWFSGHHVHFSNLVLFHKLVQVDDIDKDPATLTHLRQRPRPNQVANRPGAPSKVLPCLFHTVETLQHCFTHPPPLLSFLRICPSAPKSANRSA